MINAIEGYRSLWHLALAPHKLTAYSVIQILPRYHIKLPHVGPLNPPRFLVLLPPLKSLPIMSTNLYEILGVQRDVTDEQSTSNPFPSVVHPPLMLPQSERLTRNGRYKLTLIVSLRSKNQPRKMSSERSSIPSIHSLLCHSLTTPGEQRI